MSLDRDASSLLPAREPVAATRVELTSVQLRIYLRYMATGTIFDNNRTQAVRLPSEVRFPSNVKKVAVLAVGRTRILVPAGESWDAWFDGEGVSADFMAERDQPIEQVRESL